MAEPNESLDSTEDTYAPTTSLEVVAADRRVRSRRRGEGENVGLVSGDDLERVIVDLQKFGSRFRQPSPRELRLATRLSIAAREVRYLAHDRKARSQPWAKAATGLISDAQQALDSGQVVGGWQLLRAAERHLIEGRPSEEVADQVRHARTRLEEFAPEVARDVAEITDDDPVAIQNEARRLRGLVDAYFDELDRVLHQRAKMLGHIAVLLPLVLTLAGLAVTFGLPGDDSGAVLTSIGDFVTVVGLGVAGAVVSRALRGEQNEGSQIVDETNPMLVHLFRLGIGGVAALTLAVVLQSDLQGLISATGAAAYPFAIGAGFTERFADRVYAETEKGCVVYSRAAVGVDEL